MKENEKINLISINWFYMLVQIYLTYFFILFYIKLNNLKFIKF